MKDYGQTLHLWACEIPINTTDNKMDTLCKNHWENFFKPTQYRALPKFIHNVPICLIKKTKQLTLQLGKSAHKVTTPNYKLTSVFRGIKGKCGNTNNGSQKYLFGKGHSADLNADRDGTLPGVECQEQPIFLSCHPALFVRICKGNAPVLVG